jgi:hypothetical protein
MHMARCQGRYMSARSKQARVDPHLAGIGKLPALTGWYRYFLSVFLYRKL